MMKRNVVSIAFAAVMALFASSAMAAPSVSWTSPADGSVYPVGTSVNLTGNASASGGTVGTGLDLMLVIDTSGSMTGTRITAVKTAAVALINALPLGTTQVGIVEFDSGVNLTRQLQVLTSNKADLIAAVNGLVTYGMTATGPGIVAATGELTSVRANSGSAKMMVVLSDGQHNSGINPVIAAATAATQKITVHTVGVELIQGSAAYNSMQNIANDGNGVFTNVTDLTALEGLFSGTGGNLVGIAKVDILLPNGTTLYNVFIDGLGNFSLPNQVIAPGANTFTATAYDTAQDFASANITLIGRDNGHAPIPEPATMLLFGAGLAGLAGYGRRKRA